MALTFGQMTQQILAETLSDQGQAQAVQNAIVTAIKELEVQHIFVNQKEVHMLVSPRQVEVPLPEDFINTVVMYLIVPPNNGPQSPTPPPPPPYPDQGYSIYTEARGFRNYTMRDLSTFRQYQQYLGCPAGWALFGNDLHLWPPADAYYYIHMFYYYRDGSYPTNVDDTSIWMGDFTQDVTRYRARSIFYRDQLQNLELAASDMQRSEDSLDKLRSRSSDRATIYNMSY